MSHLKALKLTSAVPVRATVDPVQRAREKMIATLATRIPVSLLDLAYVEVVIDDIAWARPFR
ncbi:hypothetical protein [Agrobacterium sp. NPDC090283]|uniref:hypothetical protein n=1 Tax=Agrobacterium sp. NPDC090283 TaxID=3363920 RepID=UPI00383A436B